MAVVYYAVHQIRLFKYNVCFSFFGFRVTEVLPVEQRAADKTFAASFFHIVYKCIEKSGIVNCADKNAWMIQ